MTYIIFLLLSFSAWALEVPKLTSPVMDQASILSEVEKSELSDKIRTIHNQGLVQMSILIVPSLENANLEEYSMKVAETWKLGSKEKDNGLFILLAMKEKKIRIEVGNGIEGEITDYLSSSIILDMKSFMRNKEYKNALLVAVNKVYETMEATLPGNVAARAEAKKFKDEQDRQYAILADKRWEETKVKAKQFFSLISLVSLFAGSFLLFFLSFNKNKVQEYTTALLKAEKHGAEQTETLDSIKHEHRALKVDHTKYKFVILKDEVLSLNRKKNKFTGEIKVMKQKLGV